jgi:predicted ester cyclase
LAAKEDLRVRSCLRGATIVRKVIIEPGKAPTVNHGTTSMDPPWASSMERKCSHKRPGRREEGNVCRANVFGAFRAAFPDGHTTIEDTFAEGDTVVTRWTFRGTHRGEFASLPPTGRRVEMTGINIDRTADGRFIKRWYEMDRLGLMRQLGAAPDTGQDEIPG